MPTNISNASSSDLFANVPVDKFTIVNGPMPLRCLQLLAAIQLAQRAGEPVAVEQRFTLTTPASEKTFIRKLHLADIYCVQSDESFSFTATFNGRVVSGVYAPKTRQGWFSLD